MINGADGTYLTLDKLLELEEYALNCRRFYPDDRVPVPAGVYLVTDDRKLRNTELDPARLKVRIDNTLRRMFANGRK